MVSVTRSERQASIFHLPVPAVQHLADDHPDLGAEDPAEPAELCLAAGDGA